MKWWYGLRVRAKIKRLFSDGIWQGTKRVPRVVIKKILQLIHRAISAPIFAPLRSVLSFVLRQVGYSVVRSNSVAGLHRVKMTAGESLLKASEALAFAAHFYSSENAVSGNLDSDPSKWSVSVIIPTFNDSIFLPDALESAPLIVFVPENAIKLPDESTP